MDLPILSQLEQHRIHQQEVRSKYGDYVLSTYFLDSTLLNSLEATNWSKNRPADPKRVAAIATDITSTGRVQGIIGLASLSGSFVCYDGNHRRIALTKTIRSYSILVSIIWAATEDAIIDEYESLNKAISVPLIYMDVKQEQQSASNKLIANYCRSLAEDYPSFCKAAKACHPPHFNRDVLADDIMELCTEYSELLTTKQVLAIVNKMNSSYASGKHQFSSRTLNPTVKTKCEISGLWLFCRGRKIDRPYFELVRSVQA